MRAVSSYLPNLIFFVCVCGRGGEGSVENRFNLWLNGLLSYRNEGHSR